MKLTRKEKDIVEGCVNSRIFLIEEFDGIPPASDEEDAYYIQLALLIKKLTTTK